MTKLIAIFLIFFILISFVPAQNTGNEKVVSAYMIVYADTQEELQRKVNGYLILGIGWQLWGTIVLTDGYHSYTNGKLSQVMVQYK